MREQWELLVVHDSDELRRFRFGWLTSAWDPQALTLLEAACQALEGSHGGVEFVFVAGSPERSPYAAQFERTCRSHRIPVLFLDPKRFKSNTAAAPNVGRPSKPGNEPWRLAFETAVVDALSGFEPDIVVLAGYMLIAGPVLLERFRLINLHPALPGGPAGTRRQVMESLARARATRAGAKIHVVTSTLDEGPTLAYSSVSLSGDQWARVQRNGVTAMTDAIEMMVMSLEPDLVARTLIAISDDSNVRLCASQPPLEWVDAACQLKPLDMSPESPIPSDFLDV